MKYIDEPMKKYFEEAASGAETPGGGSISGVAGALAASMVSMVCNFTTGKQKYAEFENEIQTILQRSSKKVEEMLELAVADTEGFDEITKAYNLPKETDEQKTARTEAIQAGCKAALDAPEKIFESSLEILELLKRLVDISNRNLISDVGVSAVMARAAAEAAAMNVKINLKFIKDELYTKEKGTKLEKGLKTGDEIEQEVKAKVREAIS